MKIKFKNLFFIAFLLTGLKVSAQSIPKDSLSKQFTYQSKLIVSGANQDSLYFKLRAWLLKTYQCQKPDIDQQALGKLAHNGSFLIQASANGYTHDLRIRYTINLIVENGAFSYVITDFKSSLKEQVKPPFVRLEDYDANPSTQSGEILKMKKEIFRKIDAEMKRIIQDLKTNVK